MSALSALTSGGTAQIAYYADLYNNCAVDQAGNAAVNAIHPEVFYSLQLLETIRDAADRYQYFKYATETPIEGKAGKLTLRRWAPLEAHTVPLAEGVPPMSDKGSVEVYEITAAQYGRYMEFTDQVDFKVVDPIIAHYSAEYSIVAVETLDLLARDTLIANANIKFAPKRVTSDGTTTVTAISSMADLKESCKPAIADLRQIGLAFKRAKVKPVDSTYHVLVSPEFIFDMLDDEFVQNYMKINQTTSPMYNGVADDTVLVPMFGFSFHEVNNVSTSTVYTSSGSKYFLEYKIVGTTWTIQAKAVGDAVSGWVKDARTGKDASYIPNRLSLTCTDGFKVFKCNHIIVLGKDALVRTGLAGEGNAQMFVKPLGSAGVLDPIDQRQSIGFKINSVGFGSTRLEAIWDYICVPTTLNI